MTNKIDFRFLWISGAIVTVALATATAAIWTFRYLFPHLAAETIWDELSGSTIAALFIFGLKALLLREQVFHLLVTADLPEVRSIHVFLLRRNPGWGLMYVPTFQREAMIHNHDALIRNISWRGVYGVDRCTLCVKFDADERKFQQVIVPKVPRRTHFTIRLRLSDLRENKPLILSVQNIE